MDTIKHFDVIHTESGYRIGSIGKHHPGWFFISNTSSHGNSRVGQPTAEKAFPRWAKKMGCEMVERI